MELCLLRSMPRSFLFTSFLLISHWTTCGHATPALRMAMKPIAVDNLRHHCTIGLDDLNYDLCPLVGRTVTIEDTRYTMDADGDRGEGSSNGRRFYDVTLGGLRGKRMVSELCMLLGFLSNMCFCRSRVAMRIPGFACEVSMVRPMDPRNTLESRFWGFFLDDNAHYTPYQSHYPLVY